MTQYSIPDLIARLIVVSGGNAERAAARIGTSVANLSRWRSGHSRPRRQQEERLRALLDGMGDVVSMAERPQADARLERLEEAVSGTIHALREEFHRTASVSREEVLDLVAALFFAHVTSIDSGARGIGEHLRSKGEAAVVTLNRLVEGALATHLPSSAMRVRFANSRSGPHDLINATGRGSFHALTPEAHRRCSIQTQRKQRISRLHRANGVRLAKSLGHGSAPRQSRTEKFVSIGVVSSQPHLAQVLAATLHFRAGVQGNHPSVAASKQCFPCPGDVWRYGDKLRRPPFWFRKPAARSRRRDLFRRSARGWVRRRDP